MSLYGSLRLPLDFIFPNLPVGFGLREENFPEAKALLASNLVMPTFLKNLTSPQLKLIWQNAGVEFSEANRILFIGYSLPQADFELRQLLSRMVRNNASTEVVDYGRDEDHGIVELKRRYDIFFGAR